MMLYSDSSADESFSWMEQLLNGATSTINGLRSFVELSVTFTI